MSKFYPVVDFIPHKDMVKMGFPDCVRVEDRTKQKRNVRAIETGECRRPKKGEWYLSGSIIEAYRAPNDLSDSFPIARLVRVKIETITTIIELKEKEGEAVQ